MIFYILLSIVSALSLGALSAYTTHKFGDKTSLGKVGTAVIATLVFAAIGVVILIIGFFAAAVLADALRK